jgi:precorrin-2/cobalt-factor-2 C20-methyltransferase
MLIGLGLGPGDRELLTLKAVRLLRTAETVFVPGKMALELVSEYCQPVVLDFPMVEDEDEILRALERNADLIAPAARNGTAVLGIIGDPSFFSTFSRQCEVLKTKHPDIEFAVEPGISSITAFASRANLSLSGGFIVTDGAPPEAMVLLKVRRPRETMDRLRDQGYNKFVLAERVFMEGESIYGDDRIPESSNYFSIMYARK